MDLIKLDACPCCGGDRVASHGFGVLGARGRITHWHAYVCCSDCGTMGTHADHLIDRTAQARAVTAWNEGCRLVRRRQLDAARRASLALAR